MDGAAERMERISEARRNAEETAGEKRKSGRDKRHEWAPCRRRVSLGGGTPNP